MKLGSLQGGSFASSGNTLAMNLYLDTGNDSQFFSFSGTQFTGLNGDSYGSVTLGANGGSFNDNTVFTKSGGIAALPTTFTLGQLKAGAVTGIDAQTRVAIWIGGGNSFSSDISNISMAASTTGSLTVLEDSGLTSLGLGGLAFGSGGGVDEAGQTLSYTVTTEPSAALGNVVLADGSTVVTASTSYTLAQIQGMQFKTTANANGGGATFAFSVQDSGGTLNGGVDTITQSLTLTVTPVNDAPVVTTSGTTLAYTENAAATAIDTGLTINDVDSTNLTGATVTISANYANGQDVLAFTNQLGITGSWNAATGVLTLTGTTTVANYQTALRAVTYVNTSDSPSPSTLTRTVSFVVNDGTANSTAATRNISVAAVNDAPTASNLSASETYTEDTPLALTATVASDIDNASVTATLTLSNFAVGSLNTGTVNGVTSTYTAGTGVWTASGALADVNILLAALTFTPTLNYNSNFTIATSIDDGVAAALTGTKTLAGIAINDAPAITSGTTATTIAENTVATTVLYTATATDVDVGDTLSWSLSGTDAALMSVNTSGEVILQVSSNFESKAGYSFNVIATDSGSPNLSSSKAVTLAITNLDEVAPSITSGAVATALNENSGAGQVVYSATATDNADVSAGVTFSLGGADAGLFSIDASSGAVTLTANTDFEAKTGYSFSVLASDGVNPATAQAVTLAIGNVDEVAPSITSGAVATAIAENSGAGQLVYTVIANDSADISAGVTFSLGGADAGLFSIDASFGAVTLTGNPDFEAKAAYSFSVLASDGVNPATAQAVTLAINNLDEVAPSITSGAVATALNENSGAGQVVYSATATDNADISAGVTFSLGGADAGLFSINTSSGAVTLTANPDFETIPGYSFSVLASDGVNPATIQAVTLAINNLDEVAPTITSGAVATTLNENSGVGQVVYTVIATDTADFSAGVSFSLGGADAGLFSIDTSSGAVTLIANPDFETKTGYSFSVLASDGVNPATAQAVSLAIINVNEAPTATNLSAAETYTEDTTRNLIHIVISDVDSANITATLTLSSAAAGSLNIGTSNALTSTYNAGTGVWNASGAIADVNTLLASLTFTPTLNFNGTFTITTSISDGVAAAIAGSKTMLGIAVNDAPIASGGTTLTSVLEDTLSPSGAKVSSLFASNFTDPADNSNPGQNQFVGVGVRGQFVNALNGRWQFSIDNGVNWSNFGGLSDTNAVGLQLSDSLRFLPAADYNGSPNSLTARLIDNSITITSGVTVDMSPFGGSTAFSTATVIVSTSITPVADTPSVTNATTNEDTQSSSGLVISRSVKDGNEVSNFKINTITNGTLYMNDGTTQITSGAFITFAEGNAGLKFTPTANFNGIGSFTIQASKSNNDTGLGGSTVNATITVSSVNDAPTASVTIDNTTPAQGQTLTASNTLTDADGLGSITYTWKAAGANVGTGGTYVLTEADVDKTITVLASYTDGHGTAEAVSSAATPVVANVNDLPSGLVTISGTPTQNQTLTASNTLADADGLGPIRYQWQAAGIAIAGATTSTYTLSEAEVGKTLAVLASYTDARGTAETVSSAATAAVANVNDLPTGVVTISGTPTQGQTLTASNTLADPDGLGTISYQWQAGGIAISGATNSTYTLSEADVGKTLAVLASYTDGHGINVAISSAATAAVASVNNAPTATSLNTSQIYIEDTSLNLVAIIIKNVSSANVTATLTLSNATAGNLNTGTSNGTTSTFVGGVWTASGAIADVNALLARLTFTPTLNFNSSFTIATRINDGLTSAITGSKIMIGIPVNDTPSGTVSITGTPTFGLALFADNTLSDVDGLGSVLYQWQADGVDISGATDSRYVPGVADIGKTLSVSARYSDAFGQLEIVRSVANWVVGSIISVVPSTAANSSSPQGLYINPVSIDSSNVHAVDVIAAIKATLIGDVKASPSNKYIATSQSTRDAVIINIAAPEKQTLVASTNSELPQSVGAQPRSNSLAANFKYLQASSKRDYAVDMDHVFTQREQLVLWQHLETMRQQIDQSELDHKSLEINIVVGATVSITAGFVSWVLRGGTLLASLLSNVPLLKRFDPLPIFITAKKAAASTSSETQQHSDEAIEDKVELFFSKTTHDEHD